MESVLKITIKWNKYQSKVTLNHYLDTKPLFRLLNRYKFSGLKRLFVLSYEDNAHFSPNVEINDYNVMIDGRNLFGQPVKNDIRAYDNI